MSDMSVNDLICEGCGGTNRPGSGHFCAACHARLMSRPARRPVCGRLAREALLAAVLGALPEDARWTVDERERWLALIEAAVRYLIEVVE